MNTILAAIDSSGGSVLVASVAREFAKATRSRLVLVTVVPPPIVVPEAPLLATDMAEVAGESARVSARHLAKVHKRVAGRGVKVDQVQLSGPPVGQILALAKERAADYLVMGSHGHNAVYDLLVGSTTHGVLHDAPCPVLIVPVARKVKARKRR